MAIRKSKHTPTPWHVGLRPGPIVYGPDGTQIADCRFPAEDTADAVFLVHAVNMHDGLVSSTKHTADMLRIVCNALEAAINDLTLAAAIADGRGDEGAATEIRAHIVIYDDTLHRVYGE